MTLKLQLAPSNPLEIKADLLVVGVLEGNVADNPVVAALHRALGGGLTELIQAEEFKGKRDQRLSIPTLGRVAVAKVVLLGLGAEKAITEPSVRVFGAVAARAALSEKATSLGVSIPEPVSRDHLRPLAEGLVLGAYRFSKYFTGDRRPKKELSRIAIAVGGKKKPGVAEQRAVDLGVAVARGVCIARDLQNEPPNELTPRALAHAAAKVAKDHGLKSTVLDMKGLVRAGMKLLVAVGQGSVNEPHFAHVVYTPAKKAKKKIVFVGKGITFDSGGLCIKPAAGMGDMKTDMSGAANVVGLIAAVAATKPDVEVHFIIGCAENMPDAGAYRPSDVFGSLDGKTVEIVNTDAEGRLILADCLAYARKLKPDVIVDNATLTGACVVALGNNCSGFFATNDELADTFRAAAKGAGEQFWQLPLLEDLKEQLKSDIADLKHTGDRWGGSITAALFLREFVGDVPFVHCDIAGPSLSSRAYGIYPKGGTGHGMLTFLRFVHAYSLAVPSPPPEAAMPARDPLAELSRKLSKSMARAIRDFKMIEDGDRILCAVSGGKDSYTMHRLLLELRERAPVRFDVIAVNIDQGHPGYPAHVLTDYMEQRGHAFHLEQEDTYSIVTEKVPAGKTFCSLCSRLRRGILYRLRRELGCTKIALGHHRDDVITTLMLNLMFAGSLKAMPPKLIADDGESVVIRPLVFAAEDDIAAYAALCEFPILPCDLCGSQDGLQRKIVSNLLRDLERTAPGVRESMLAALANVRPTHLLDTSLWQRLGLSVASDLDDVKMGTMVPPERLVRHS